MSRNFRVLLAVAGVAFGMSLLTTSPTQADHDDDDRWEHRGHHHHHGSHRHGRYHRHDHFYRPGGMWDRLHGGYERHPQYGYRWYDYYGPYYGYGYPNYGGGFGYGGYSEGVGIMLRSR